MSDVWVAETWSAHGYNHAIQGVYESREAAFDGLKSEPNMTVWVENGIVRAKPKAEGNLWHHQDREKWGMANPFSIKGKSG